MTSLLPAAQSLGVSLSTAQVDTLERYASLMLLWNKKINLTAITNPEEVRIKHLLDCLSLAPHVQGSSLLDVGTGAGLPALVVAVARPELRVTAFDKSVKRISFIRQCILELGIENLSAEHGRIEDYDLQFDTVTSRAFSSLIDFSACEKNCAKGGELIAMKGQLPLDEMSQLQSKFDITTIALKVPKLEAERCLVKLIPKR